MIFRNEVSKSVISFHPESISFRRQNLLVFFPETQLFTTYFTKIFTGHVKKRISHARAEAALEVE